MQITVLTTWFDQGYVGVMTFIFEMILEGDSWKIANIIK